MATVPPGTPSTPVTPSGGANPALKPTSANPVADPTKATGSIAVKGAPFQINPLQERDKWLKMLVYGGHGRGKTELCGSAVDVDSMRDVLLINAEKGDMTLRDSIRIKNHELIDTITINNFKQVAQIQEFLVAHCSIVKSGREDALAVLQEKYFGIPLEQAGRLRKYKTVIIDSLTEVEQFNTYNILNLDINKVPDDIDVAGWPEFRKNFEMLKLLIRSFRDLPMHVLMIAQEAFTKDERGAMHYGPMLTGKLGTQVQGFVDIVGYLLMGQANDKQEAPRKLYVQPVIVPGLHKFDAKNRKASFTGSSFDNPKMLDIMKAVKLIEG